MFPLALRQEAERLLQLCREAGKKIVTAESCTGGLIAACLTEIAGSSEIVERGFVTYSNEAKTELLSVPADMIRAQGAVSAEVAEAMVTGALEKSHADVAISVTGIAGPGGATKTKPVGLVFLGICQRGKVPEHRRFVFSGDRQAVRLASVAAAMELLRLEIGQAEL